MADDSSAKEDGIRTAMEANTTASSLAESSSPVGDQALGALDTAMTEELPANATDTLDAKEEEEPDAMDLDDAFQEDARAFAMSLDALSDGNQHEELYPDAPPFTTTTSEPPNSTGNTEIEDNQPREAAATATAAPATATMELLPVEFHVQQPIKIKQEKKPSQPKTAQGTRKSPRRSNQSKASNTNTKKSSAANTGGTSTHTGSKRTSSNATSGGAAAGSQNQSFSWNDILRVQNLIERCLQQYLSKNDIMATLKTQANVEPSFTAVVWQKLEEQNPSFFRAYTLQLQLKEQISAFNYLVSQQKEMMAKASGNAAFLSFLASSSDSNKATQRQGAASSSNSSSRAASRMAGGRNRSTLSSASSASYQVGNNFNGLLSSKTFIAPSPLPLPSPIKTDLDTHAFFS